MKESACATVQRKQANRISAKRSRDKFVEEKQKVKAKIGALVELNAKLRLDRVEAERQERKLQAHVVYMNSLLAEATVEGALLLRELQALRAATQSEKVDGMTTGFGAADARNMWALKQTLAGNVLPAIGNLNSGNQALARYMDQISMSQDTTSPVSYDDFSAFFS